MPPIINSLTGGHIHINTPTYTHIHACKLTYTQTQTNTQTYTNTYIHTDVHKKETRCVLACGPHVPGLKTQNSSQRTLL